MIGFIFLAVGLCFSVIGLVLYFLTIQGKTKTSSLARWSVYGGAAGIVGASLILLLDILRHNFANAYVWGYSDRSLPLHFLVSTFYAGQEGSFMFWALCSAIISLALLRYSRKRGFDAHVMTVFLATQVFLLVLLLSKSPFKSIWDAFPGQLAPDQVPTDGKGLNPLLQNFWMVIHPPVLFVGFAAMAVPYSLAIAALWRKEYQTWLTDALPWIIFAGTVLGIGIILGGYWAYGVLGWGGYWGWDPVENSSLIPWLVSMALIHTIVIQKRSGNLVRTNFILTILAFVLVLYSTFLTRSGILGDASVHSFTDPGAAVYGLLIGFVVLFALIGLVMMTLRNKEFSRLVLPMKFFSRSYGLWIGALVVLAMAVVIFFGTNLPLFSSTRVEPSFYDRMNLPLAILGALLIGYSLHLRWDFEDGIAALRRSMKWGIGSLVLSIICWFLGVQDPALLLFCFASFFTLLVNGEFAYMISRGDPRLLGGKIAHIGLAIFFFGVIASGKYATKEIVLLPQDAPTNVLGYTLTYKGSRLIEGHKYAFDVDVQKGGSQALLSPVMFETGEQGTMRNPDILSFATQDFYLSPLGVEQAKDRSQHGLEMITLEKGKPATISDVVVKFVRFDLSQHGKSSMMEGGSGGMLVGAVLELQSGKQREEIVPAAMYEQGAPVSYTVADSKLLKSKIQLVSMNVGMGQGTSTVTIGVVKEGAAGAKNPEKLQVEVSIKPGINLIWAGSVLLFIGLILSWLHRRKEA